MGRGVSRRGMPFPRSAASASRMPSLVEFAERASLPLGTCSEAQLVSLVCA
jgi:hypothetical protein